MSIIRQELLVDYIDELSVARMIGSDQPVTNKKSEYAFGRA